MTEKHSPLRIVIHEPSTEKGRLDLARRTAQIHADAVLQAVRAFRGSPSQKEALLDAVIASALNPPSGE